MGDRKGMPVEGEEYRRAQPLVALGGGESPDDLRVPPVDSVEHADRDGGAGKGAGFEFARMCDDFHDVTERAPPRRPTIP